MPAPTPLPALILGAGAAGLMCAAHAGPGAVVIDHMDRPGEKIRISGGGRCNFTNMYAGPQNFLSANPHFAKSALSRYTQWDFVYLMGRHGVTWHEKTLGQLFCDEKSERVIRLLLDEVAAAQAEVWLKTEVREIRHADGRFVVDLIRDGQPLTVTTRALVVASGGKSIPKIGATGLGYRIAEQFGHALTDTRPGLVPLTFGDSFSDLAGVACPARLSCNGTSFDEALLFTHRGLSGPAILQISNFWHEGEDVSVRLCPDLDFLSSLKEERQRAGRRDLETVLAGLLPKRLAAQVVRDSGLKGRLADLSDAALAPLLDRLTDWHLRPTGTEGYRKAEVTLGGVDTAGLSSRSMESRSVPGLHFIGEVVDVTGWLGGYNFQWAWSSGWAAGTAIAARGHG
ncbi:NAD(P)/FAD-dependent oxidoreductase [Fluviibacterium sp. DFM31]|uniref:NAD(P)/FAD-dependent oxidoreductase n=1 Tax=Meridianimarinicoccus marinus TaxID=3231483 RepID=A0ABV3L802_9RHOB